jgi:hypothetical protein
MGDITASSTLLDALPAIDLTMPESDIAKQWQQELQVYMLHSRNGTLAPLPNSCHQTLQMMRATSTTMDLTASRGFQREGLVPTRQTKPSMRSRRYSIDVSTGKNWGKDHRAYLTTFNGYYDSRVSSNSSTLTSILAPLEGAMASSGAPCQQCAAIYSSTL